MNDTFEKLRRSSNRKSKCKRCGGEMGSGPRGRVMLMVEKHHGEKRNVQASMSRNLCEPCSVRVWKTLQNAFQDQLEGR